MARSCPNGPSECHVCGNNNVHVDRVLSRSQLYLHVSCAMICHGGSLPSAASRSTHQDESVPVDSCVEQRAHEVRYGTVFVRHTILNRRD